MFKKSASWPLVISQLAILALGAQVSYGATTTTPEMQMLESIISLQGQQLPNDELQAKMGAEISHYRSIASTDGQAERMQSALVALNIFTPAQAQGYWTDVQNQTAAVSANQITVPQAIQNLAVLASSGAQFSTCIAGLSGMLAGGGVLYLICEADGFVGPSNALGFGIEMGSLAALGVGILLAAIPSGCR